MTIRILCLLAALLAGACDRIPELAATSTGAVRIDRPDMRPDYRDGRVGIEPEFRAFVADRRLDMPTGGWWVARSDGTIGGITADGAAIAGTWDWRGGRFCRHLRSGALPGPDGDDCQVVAIAANGIVFTARSGRGAAVIYV